MGNNVARPCLSEYQGDGQTTRFDCEYRPMADIQIIVVRTQKGGDQYLFERRWIPSGAPYVYGTDYTLDRENKQIVFTVPPDERQCFVVAFYWYPDEQEGYYGTR
jgi:hypothetical protein